MTSGSEDDKSFARNAINRETFEQMNYEDDEEADKIKEMYVSQAAAAAVPKLRLEPPSPSKTMYDSS